MGFEIANTVFASKPTVDDKYTNYSGVMDELGAHGAGFAVYDQPGPATGHATGCGIADHVHFCVMAPNFNSGAAGNVLYIAETFVASAQLSSTTRATVVAVHENDVSLGIDQQRPKFSTRTIRRFGQSQTLGNANIYVFVFHFAILPEFAR
jgi:hypothetical protein